MCIDFEKPIARRKSMNLFMPTVNINQVLLLSGRPVLPSKAVQHADRSAWRRSRLQPV